MYLPTYYLVRHLWFHDVKLSVPVRIVDLGVRLKKF